MMARRCLTLIRENSQIIDNTPINYKDIKPLAFDDDDQFPQEYPEEELTLKRQKSNKKEKIQQKNIDVGKDLSIIKNDNKHNINQDEIHSRKEKEKEKEKLEDIFQTPLNLQLIGLSRSKSVIHKKKSDNIFLENENKPSNLSKKQKPQLKAKKSKKLNIGHTETTTKLFDKKKNEEKKEKPSKKIINVIKKVVEWRKMCYQEFMKKTGTKVSKEDAALKLGMKKKSLDDYLMIIRLGILLSFSFETNLHKKFGELRNFVKDNKASSDKWTKEKSEDVEELLERLNK